MIGSTIKHLRKKAKYTQEELGKLIGVSKTCICNYEAGAREPESNTIAKLAEIFNVDINYLFQWQTDYENGGIKIPVLGRVAAGIPIEAITDILDYEEIPAEMMKDGSEYFALQIKGESMEPKISDGDVVIVRKQETCDSGDIAIVSINGDDATCKKVMIHEAGISLVPNNSAFPVMFFTKEQIIDTPIRIYGKVVELRAKF